MDKNEVKLYRLRKKGIHPFDKYVHFIISDPTTYEEIPSLGDDYASQCDHKLYDDIKKEDISRIFIYGEYIKRKFYLDCNIETSDGNYVKDKNKKYYIKKKYKTYEDIKNAAMEKFITPDWHIIFDINLDYGECKNFNPSPEDLDFYVLIKKFFYYYIKKIKFILISPDTFSSFMTPEDINYIKQTFVNRRCSIYFCEKLLYALSEPDFLKVMRVKSRHLSNKNNIFNNNPFSKLCTIMHSYFNFSFNNSFLLLYRCIIDKYFMYLSDLFKIQDTKNILPDNLSAVNIPRFFFLPIEPTEDIYANKNIDFNLDILDNRINIVINLDNKIDSISIADYVHDCLMVALYQHKQNLALNYSKKEILYFNDLIDSNNKHNKTDKFSERIIGLYIWDKINRLSKEVSRSPEKMSLNWIINNLKSKHYINESSSEQAIYKKYNRIYNSTKECIEKLEYLPLK